MGAAGHLDALNFSPVIFQGQLLPIVSTDSFTPARHGQQTASLEVYEGTCIAVKRCIKLSSVDIALPQEANRRDVSIAVEFKLGVDGKLSMSATALSLKDDKGKVHTQNLTTFVRSAAFSSVDLLGERRG